MDTGARSEASPLDERFSLEDVIGGLAGDLRALRAGSISIEDARTRAELAKQLFNGVRLVINARRHLESRLNLPPATEAADG